MPQDFSKDFEPAEGSRETVDRQLEKQKAGQVEKPAKDGSAAPEPAERKGDPQSK